jgi:SAM-dependent methyltransferase
MKDKFKFLKGKLLSGRVYPEFFPFNSNDHVINIGCGEGPQTIVYARQYNKMVGVDIDRERLEKSKEAMKFYGVKDYTMLCTNVEKIPLKDCIFDKALAVDIIEHVQNPKKLCLEANRLLKENGELLITFPAMHDKFTNLVSKIGRFVLRRNKKETHSAEWNPDAHNQEYPLNEWIAIVESCGFVLYKSRGSTLFPPLHLYGIPRFWFSNNIIHKIDSFLCKKPFLKNYGQALVCIFKKEKSLS